MFITEGVNNLHLRCQMSDLLGIYILPKKNILKSSTGWFSNPNGVAIFHHKMKQLVTSRQFKNEIVSKCSVTN